LRALSDVLDEQTGALISNEAGLADRLIRNLNCGR
jgi:hypothetical protein